jgi:septal ring factor EnvC (AmiA/AmiB activator)
VKDNPGVYSEMCENAATHSLNIPRVQGQMEDFMWEKLTPKVTGFISDCAPSAIKAALPGLLSGENNALHEITEMIKEIRTSQNETSKQIEDLKTGQTKSSTELTDVIKRLTNLESQVTNSTQSFTTIAEGLRGQLKDFSDKAFKADDPGSLIYKVNIANRRMVDLSIKAAQVSN